MILLIDKEEDDIENNTMRGLYLVAFLWSVSIFYDGFDIKF